jgi:uncharacterized protein (TIGR00295 family)
MNPIPDPKTCIDLLKKAGCSKEVIDHCKAVRDIAVKIAKKAGADVYLVEAGALLHDIGRAKTHNIQHVLHGVEIAKRLGLSEKIIRIIETHIGAGIPSEEAKKLGLPDKDFIPETLEEKIICHADSLIVKNKKQNIENEVEKALLKGHRSYATRLISLHKELSNICGIDLNKI